MICQVLSIPNTILWVHFSNINGTVSVNPHGLFACLFHGSLQRFSMLVAIQIIQTVIPQQKVVKVIGQPLKYPRYPRYPTDMIFCEKL